MQRETEITIDLALALSTVEVGCLIITRVAGEASIHHLGGPQGFIRILNPTTLAFAEGDKDCQMASDLNKDDRALLLLEDCNGQRNIKIWGRAVITDARDLAIHLASPGGRVVLMSVDAWSFIPLTGVMPA